MHKRNVKRKKAADQGTWKPVSHGRRAEEGNAGHDHINAENYGADW